MAWDPKQIGHTCQTRACLPDDSEHAFVKDEYGNPDVENCVDQCMLDEGNERRWASHVSAHAHKSHLYEARNLPYHHHALPTACC